MRLSFLLLIGIAVFLGCSEWQKFFDFQKPVIVSYSPARDSGVGVDDPIYIQFSKPMEKKSVTHLLSFSPKSGYADYSLRWEGNRLVILPTYALEENQEYELRLKEGSRDLSGNQIQKDWVITFITREKNRGDFSVTESFPAGYFLGVTNLHPDFVFTFSLPLRPDQEFSSLVDLNPQIEAVYSLTNDGLTLKMTLIESLSPQTRYKANISANLFSSNLIALEEDWYTYFYTGDPRQGTAFLGVYPITQTNYNPRAVENIYSNFSTLLRTDLGFFFEFSIPMNRESVEEAISYSPSIGGYYEWLDEFTVIYHPDVDLNYDTIYIFTVAQTAYDVTGSFLGSETQLQLTTRNPYNTPLSITRATVKNTCSEEVVLTEDFFNPVDIPIEGPTTANRFSFELNSENDISLPSFYESGVFRISCMGNCGNTKAPAEIEKQVISHNPLLNTPLILQTVFRNLDNSVPLYILSVNNNQLRDIRGRKLERSYHFGFRPRSMSSCP